MSECPDDNELAAFLNESLPTAQLIPVSGHVDGCPRCQERLDRLTEPASGAVARYKELSPAIPPNAPLGGAAPSPGDETMLTRHRAGPPAFVWLPPVPGFDVVAEMGRGGKCVVYKARHRRLNRLVALKTLPAGTIDPDIAQQFLFEAKVLARIRHPRVVQLFEVDTYRGPDDVPIPYLATELLEGGSLARKLREHATGSIAPRAAAELLEGIAQAAHAIHQQGIVHTDLKPANILFAVGSSEKEPVASSLPSLSPKVTGFGLAAFAQDGAADVSALGAILFECLTGRPPFADAEPVNALGKILHEAPPDARTLPPSVPRALAAIAMKCLEKEPGRRYATAGALADDLRRFLDNLPTQARPGTQFERLWLWVRRNPVGAGLVAALVAAVVAVVLFWAWAG